MRVPRFRLRSVMIAIAVLTVLSYVGVRLWSFYSLPKGTRDVLARLDQPVRFAGPGPIPLRDALETIRAATQKPGDNGIPLYVNEISLQQVGATMDTEVRVDPGPSRVDACLRQMLGPLGLGCYVYDGMIEITSEDLAEHARHSIPGARRP